MKYPTLAVAAVISAAALSQANAIDITVSDPHGDKSFSGVNLGPNGPENNTVQFNAVADQTWDLESFDLTGSSLSMTGGFNFLTGMGTHATTPFPMGDIFVYLGTEAPYTVPSVDDHNGPWTGEDNWDFVIHFDRGTDNNIRNTLGSGVGYEILANGAAAESYTGGSQSLNQGLPWLVTEGFSPSEFANFSNSPDAEGNHYTIGGIDVSSILSAGQSFYLHTTMKCGNDVLWGQASVPDGGSALALLGLGIGAIGFFRNRRK